MLKISKFTILTLFIALLSTNIKSQNNTNSPYSMFGIGELSDLGLGRSKAMGGVSSPLFSNLYLNPDNPASYAALGMSTVIFEVGISAKNNTITTMDDSYTSFDGNISYIALGLSFSKWWRAGIGLKPTSSIGYNIQQSITQEYDSTEITNIYKGEGGLNSLYIDNSFKITNSLSLGIKSSYVFGSLDKIKSTTSYNNSSSTVITQKDRALVSSLAFSTGLHYHKLISDNLILNIGATYSLKNDIKANNTKFVTSVVSTSTGNLFVDTLIDATLKEGVLEIPQTFSSGFSVIFKNKYEIGFDYYRANWSNSKFFGETQNLTNLQKFATGIEFTPDYRSTKYFKVIRYRAGANFSKSYLLYDNKQLNSYELDFGLGLPLKNSSTLINLTFGYGTRYVPNQSNLLSESYFSFNLDLSLHAFWFQKRLLK